MHVALTSAGGRLADPTNLPFNDAHLDDDTRKAAWTTCSPESLTWATASLTLQRRKRIGDRTPTEPVEQSLSYWFVEPL